MSSHPAGNTGSSGAAATQVVNEIPDALNKLLMMVVKNFLSNEHFLVVSHIMTAQCIKEDDLKTQLQFDLKFLRQLLAQLKQEKLVKERLISQKNENNRKVTINFYYINYRAVLNVIAYKIFQMRHKLESREQMNNKSPKYKCIACQTSYDMLEINRILNVETGQLVCWKCQGEVTADESTAPTRGTRTAVARFNDQMAPFYAHMRSLHNIQLAPHLLEPDITKYLEDDKAQELLQQQQIDFTSGNGRGNGATINYLNEDAVVVDLNANLNKGAVEEAKEMPDWLKDTALRGEASHNDYVLDQAKTEDDVKYPRPSGISIAYLKEIESDVVLPVKKEEPAMMQIKLEEPEFDGNEMPNGGFVKMEVDYEEEEEMVCLGSRVLPLSQITAQMVEEEMDEQQQEEYCATVQELYSFFFHSEFIPPN